MKKKVIMSSLVNSYNNNNTQENTKDRWCILAYANHIKIFLKNNGMDPKLYGLDKVKRCRFKHNCYYAHKRSEISLLPYLEDFNKSDKSKLNILDHYLIMKNLLIKNKAKLKIKEKNMINESDLDNFFVVLELWRNFNCEYSRISKDYKKNRFKYQNRFKFAHLIPSFDYDNSDKMWAVYKYTRYCNEFKKLNQNIKQCVKINIDEVCRRDKNCKLGCHEDFELICTDDLIKGSCNCKYKNKEILLKEIKEMEENKIDTKEKIEHLYKVKKHLTLEGLVPFNALKEKHLDDKKKSGKQNEISNEKLQENLSTLSLNKQREKNKSRLSFLKK